jgi:hypothetical protein
MQANTALGTLPTEEELPEGGEAQETQPEAKAPETDWKAKFEALEQAKTKADNDLKALRGQRMTEQQREERMEAILERQEATDLKMSALIKALGNNTTEELPAEVAKLQAVSQQTQGQRRFQTQYKSLYEDFTAVGQDDEGNAVLDVEKAPELEEARRTFAAGYHRNDLDNTDRLVMFAKAIAQGKQATMKALRARNQAETQRVKEEGKAAAKKVRDDAGLLDLDTGHEAGGGGVKTKAALLNLKKVTDMSDDDYFKIVGG